MSNQSVQKEKSPSQQDVGDQENPIGEKETVAKDVGDGVVQDQAVESGETNENGDAVGKDEGDKAAEEEEKPFSYIEMLDVPRAVLEPVDLTLDYLKQIADELGLIKLCWPDLTNVCFEDRTNFPENYLSNNEKEKLLLLYAENFRRQFCFKYPDRKPLFLACDNECGMQKMVCTTIRPTTLPYALLGSWKQCSLFVADHLKYEPLEIPTLFPRHLYSPHTIFLRQSGHCFDIATALCSLLIGQGYEAYVVSGYAIKDVTHRIMCRVSCPYPPTTEEEIKEDLLEEDEKYKIVTPKGLESKFLAMMKQRELDQLREEEERLAQLELERIQEEEKRPFDELEGQRIHAWILLGAAGRNNEPMVFIEPSTGASHPLDVDLYCGIESLWNNENYWVNLQDCSRGLNNLNYGLTDTANWEHLLVGEPIKWRQQKAAEIGDEEIDDVSDEKHLDVPYPWSTKINIANEVLMRRFPDGSKVTQYKRTLVEEYAPYVLEDGMVQKITRYTDFNCTVVESVEEKFENRHDKLVRSIFDVKTNRMTEYFSPGREDSVVKHIYYKTGEDDMEVKRVIFFNSKARFDGLSMIEIDAHLLTEHYCDREDMLYYRQVVYDSPISSLNEANRRSIQQIVQKFRRNEAVSAYNDLNRREFNIKDRKIYLKYHYGKDNITASTRNFIKPPISEMGEGMTFRPELTTGYQAQIGAKPPRQLQLFLLLEQQLKDEKKVIESIRDFENQISEFLLQRAHEMAFSKLDVSIYNREQNQTYKERMLEQEEKQRLYKEKEVEKEVDYLSPYLARLGSPSFLDYSQALDVKYQCLKDFKELLVKRANDIQKYFEITSEKAQGMQLWYTQNHDDLTSDEEANYFKEVNDLIFLMRTLEIRLSRHKELSYFRYLAMENYLYKHPMFEVLNE